MDFSDFPSPGAYVLLCGLLCGYPLGARLCAEKLKNKELSLAEARCLLATANHPSPMFLLGFVNRQVIRVFEHAQLPSSSYLPSPSSFSHSPWLIPLCLYLPVIPLSFLARHFYQFERFEKQDSQDSQKSQNLQEYREPSSDTSGASGVSVEDAIFSTAHTMVLIGGWIMLFSILAKWVQTIPCFSPSIKAILGGIAEITTGIPLLCSAFSEKKTLCLILVTGCVAFGGGSGIFQTRSVLLVKQKNAGLSIRHYILWKALHALLATGTLIFLLWLLPELERVLPAVPALLQRVIGYSRRELIAVCCNNVIGGLQGGVECLKMSSGLLHRMTHDRLKTSEHIVGVVNCALANAVCINSCAVHDCLSLLLSFLNNTICSAYAFCMISCSFTSSLV